MSSRSYPVSFSFLLLLFASTLLISCDRDHDVIDNNSASYHIAKSESLSIPASVDLPANAPAGNKRVLTYFAEGVQKYKAQKDPGSDPATYKWVFVAPLADLYNNQNQKIGNHSAGPTWQLLNSFTDSIYGQAFSPARTAPSPDPNSIDWLLLMPKVGNTPTGVFANVEYIQRIATVGGKAPAVLPTTADATVDVRYTAVYRFSRKM